MMATEKKITYMLGAMTLVSSLFLGISAMNYHQSAAATSTAIDAMEKGNEAEKAADNAVGTLSTHIAESKVASDSVQKELVEIKTDVKEQRADVRQLLIDVGQLSGE
jgi:hypothetical protein